jgi:hypothetical protein
MRTPTVEIRIVMSVMTPSITITLSNTYSIKIKKRSRKRNCLTKKTRRTSMRNKDLTPKVPRGLRLLPSGVPTNDPGAEYDSLKAEAAKIEQWWSEDRWYDTQRVYSGILTVIDGSV